MQVQTLQGNKNWDGRVGEIVKPIEFGKLGVRLDEAKERCIRFFPEELTVVEAPPPHKLGDIIIISAPKRVNCDYKQHNGCWAVVTGIGQLGSIQVQLAGKKMSVKNSDAEPIDSPPDTLKQVAEKVNKLLALDDLDEIARETLQLYLRRQVFNPRQLQHLDQIWNAYQDVQIS